jgi:hypothetical protein
LAVAVGAVCRVPLAEHLVHPSKDTINTAKLRRRGVDLDAESST